jgi:hypothetical protein
VALGAAGSGTDDVDAARARWRAIAVQESKVGNPDLAVAALEAWVASLGIEAAMAEAEGLETAPALRARLHAAIDELDRTASSGLGGEGATPPLVRALEWAPERAFALRDRLLDSAGWQPWLMGGEVAEALGSDPRALAAREEIAPAGDSASSIEALQALGERGRAALGRRLFRHLQGRELPAARAVAQALLANDPFHLDARTALALLDDPDATGGALTADDLATATGGAGWAIGSARVLVLLEHRLKASERPALRLALARRCLAAGLAVDARRVAAPLAQGTTAPTPLREAARQVMAFGALALGDVAAFHAWEREHPAAVDSPSVADAVLDGGHAADVPSTRDALLAARSELLLGPTLATRSERRRWLEELTASPGAPPDVRTRALAAVRALSPPLGERAGRLPRAAPRSQGLS